MALFAVEVCRLEDFSSRDFHVLLDYDPLKFEREFETRRTGMQLGWNREAWTPLVCKILLGTLAAGLLMVFIFHQPWFPVEITRADTGVLVALPTSVRPTTHHFGSVESSKPGFSEGEPITVPLMEPTGHVSEPTAPTGGMVQTAEISSPELRSDRKRLAPTYSQNIAPLIQKHCVHCHQDQAAGLLLTDAVQVMAAASRIAEVTTSRRMPPWKPKAGYGNFQNERRLSEAEIELFQQWAQAGAALGDTAEFTEFHPEAWQLGQPTVAYQLPQAFEVPASDTGLQWNFVIPTGVKRELILTGLELRPGNKALVQRMILSYDPTGTARQKDQQTPLPGFRSAQPHRMASSVMLGEWAPGMSASPLPKDTGYHLPAGADLILTVDYAPTPVPAMDPWSMGLHISRSAPKERLGRIEVMVFPRQEERKKSFIDTETGVASYKLPTDVTLFSISPEVGDGCGIRAYATTPDGQSIPLLRIEKSEARWENRYIFSQPIRLPKDSRLMIGTWNPGPRNFAEAPPASRCGFEVATPNSAHLEPLIRHNAAANAPR